MSFSGAFKKNIYLTKEFAEFCNKVTGADLVKKNGFFILGNKAVAISNYDSKQRRWFKKNKINYMAVLPKLNKINPSFMEYSIFSKKSYEAAFKNYKKSFRKHLKQGRNFPYKIRIIKKLDEKILDKVYPVYVRLMKRHNSYIFPRSFFREYMKLPSSLLFLIEHRGVIAAYSFCFENKDNLYNSFGGGNPKYFKYRCVNVLYDERIKYACKRGMNIHAGIGVHGSGYNRFKADAGIEHYKCERFPDDAGKLRFAVWLSKCKLIGWIWCLLSKIFPKKLVYTIIPFT